MSPAEPGEGDFHNLIVSCTSKVSFLVGRFHDIF